MENKKAFTLLELLIAVLIIGVLAGIALPQYKLTVEKTKSAEALIILQNLLRAQQSYYLAHGSYTNSFENLDVSLPANQKTTTGGYVTTLPSGWKIHMVYKSYAFARNKQGTNTLVWHFSTVNNGERYCHAKQNNKIANKVCESLGGKSPRDSSNCAIGACTVYTL